MRHLAILLGGLLVTGSLLLPSAALAAQLVVIEARGADLKPGQSLEGTAALTLAAGARVVMVSAEGTTLTLKGPFSGAPEGDGGGGKANKVAESLKNLVAARAADTTSLGAARNGVPLAELPDPWLWDATAIGDVCRLDGSRAMLWRPAAEEEASLTILPADRTWTAVTKWPAGSPILALPADLPIGDGATFLLEMAGSSAALTVHVAPPALTTETMQSAWMAMSRCDRQLAALTKRLTP